MENIFKRIKVIQNFSVLIPLDKSDFITLFKKNVDSKKDSIFDSFTEPFSSGKNKFVGAIDHKGFQIRKRKVFFSVNKNSSIIKGTFRENSGRLYLNTEIKAFGVTTMTIYVIAVLFCEYFVLFKLLGSSEPFFSIFSAVLIQLLLLFGVPYFVVKSRIKRIQNELEEDIFNWIMKW